jgi:hypothetical protein
MKLPQKRLQKRREQKIRKAKGRSSTTMGGPDQRPAPEVHVRRVVRPQLLVLKTVKNTDAKKLQKQLGGFVRLNNW